MMKSSSANHARRGAAATIAVVAIFAIYWSIDQQAQLQAPFERSIPHARRLASRKPAVTKQWSSADLNAGDVLINPIARDHVKPLAAAPDPSSETGKCLVHYLHRFTEVLSPI